MINKFNKENNVSDTIRIQHCLKKIRRCSAILFFGFTVINASASYSQAKKVSINAQNVSIEYTIHEIEKQTGFLFVYDTDEINLKKKISVNTQNNSVRNVLSDILKGTGINFVEEGKNIILVKDSSVQQKQISVKGKVVDVKGEPIIGASVMEKNTTNGTITDVDGKFTLTVSDDALLEISYVGFQIQRVKAVAGKELSVTLKEDSELLDEVVVVGYGTQKKQSVTGAVATIQSSELVKAPVANTTNALVGKLPGLIAKQTSGQPGFDGSGIQIRGFGNALVIVDGVEQNFSNIDPNEIESISVLKDASAAIYGARAGNGVILVTTKRGKVGKPRITFNGTVTGQMFANFPDPVNSWQYATLMREIESNAGRPENRLSFTAEDVEKFKAGNDPRYPNTNWKDELLRKISGQQNYNFTITGGNEVVRYYTYWGLLNQDGVSKGDNIGYKRYNLRSNVDINLTKRLKLGVDVSWIKENIKQSCRKTNDVWFWMNFFDAWPTKPASFPDPTKIPNIGAGAFNAIINTHEELGGYDKYYKDLLNASMNLEYQIPGIKGLTAKARINYKYNTNENKFFQKQCEYWDYDPETEQYTLARKSLATMLNQNHGKGQTFTGQFSLNYNRTFNENHDISGLLLAEIIDSDSNNFSAHRENYITSALDELFAGGVENMKNNGSSRESGRVSYVARLNYAFKEKYLFEFTGRYDGSPNFPSNKRWGFFPSASVGWRISEESFIKNNIPWISNLKLRGGVSQTGFDSVAAFQYLTGYKFDGYFVNNGEEVPCLQSTGLANPNITWETMTLYNVGLDFSLFNNSIYSEFDAFYRTRKDMLGKRNISVPNTFGAPLPNENINSQNTRGVEFLLGYRGSIGDFKYDISGNISWARSKWDHFDEPEYTDPDEIRIRKKSGNWADRIFAYKSDGLFTSQEEIDNLDYDMDGKGNKSLHPGDIRILDLNGDKKIDWRDHTQVGTGGFPHIIYGINAKFKYKGFDLSLLGQGAADYYVQLQAGNINLDSRRTPYKVIWEERWTPENNDRNAIIPRQTLGNKWNNTNSDYWIRNVSYFRLKNITLGYAFDKGLVSKAKIENLRLFFTGTNLFTINPVKKYGLDPESPAATRGWTYPVMKTVSFGVNLTF